MAISRALELKILANVDSLNKNLKAAQDQVNGAGMSIERSFDQVKRAVTVASVAVVGFAAAFGKQAVQAASDLNETLTKSQVIFGDSAAEIENFGKTASVALGQSQRQAIDAASTFAVFGKSAGLAGADLVNFSTEFTQLASDLASFNNTTPEEAIIALGAALRGESEPIRRYGVLLNEATLKQAALELGIIKTTTQALTPQQRVLAAQAEIFKQTSDAQGDFARTSDGLANQSRILKAQLEDVSAEIGQKLLPFIVNLTKYVNEKAIPFITKYKDELQIAAGVFVALATGVLAVNAALKLYNAGIVIATVATAVFNAVLAGNPVGLIVIGVTALIAAFVILESRTGFLRKAWEFLTEKLREALDWFKRLANFFGADFETAAEKHQKTIERNTQVYDESRRAANQVTDGLRMGVLPALKDTSSASDEAGGALNALTGDFNGVAGAAGGAAGAIKVLTDRQRELNALRAGGAIPAGISPDLRQFYKSELSLISGFGGFIEGINLLPTDPFFGFGKGGNVGEAIRQRQSGSATATGGTVNININGTVLDPEGTARAVQSVIQNSSARAGELTFIPALGFE